MYRFIVRFIIKPFINALKIELNWLDKVVDDDLKKRLDEMSKERLQILLENKVAQHVFEVQTRVKKLEAQVRALYQAFKESEASKAELVCRIEKNDNRVRVMGKLIRAIQQDEVKEFFAKRIQPTEVESEDLEL